MLFGPGLAVLLLLGSSSAQINSNPCKCSALQPTGLRVSCSSQNLKEVPNFPPDTTELYLQNNQLTTVPPGTFDMLQDLRMVNLSGNPFHCGCGIKYLKTWLQRNSAVSVTPTCVSPTSLAHRPITALSDTDLPSCSQDHCAGGRYNVFLGIMLCVLIVLLLWCLRHAKNSTFILGIDVRHAGFEAESLRSLKPKHRMRLQNALLEQSDSTNWTDDPEDRLLCTGNMEILPQILDVLHKKHNIKIKTT